MAWLEGCEICHEGLLEEMDKLIEKGHSELNASKELAKQQVKKLKFELYSAENIRCRYRYHRAKKKTGEIHQLATTAKDDGQGNDDTGQEWPRCSKCKYNLVEKNYHTYEPKAHGLCRSCRQRDAQDRECKKKAREFEKIPIDEEADRYWRELTENLKIMLDEIDEGKIGKISPETFELWNDAVIFMATYRNLLNEKSICPMKIG